MNVRIFKFDIASYIHINFKNDKESGYNLKLGFAH
jgi:hypothetical protein